MITSRFEVEATALQSDGKLVAAGFFVTDDDSSPFVVARFNPDGSLDASFNTDGMVATRVGTCDDQASGIAIQPDGKILVVGTSYNVGEGSGITVLRYLGDGHQDSTFGDLGIVRLGLSSGYDQGQVLSLAEDGTIVVVGESGLFPHQRIALILDGHGKIAEQPKPYPMPKSALLPTQPDYRVEVF